MAVYPEKLLARQEARAACGSQFWEQDVQTSRSIEGTYQTLPCEPSPLPPCAHSGLNRSQQLIATQALFIPALLAYDADGGGVVLDRVMLRKGGKRWWGNLSCRAKAQKMVKKHKSGVPVGEILRDLDNYGLSARLRTALGRRCTINTLLEVPNIKEAQSAVQDQGWAEVIETSNGQPVYQGHATFKCKLPGHELKAMTTRNREYLDSAAMYSRVTSTSSADLSSNPRGDGIHYRVGVHQVTAPREEVLNGASLSPPTSQIDLETSLHLQGAVAVEGEATLWRATSDKNAWPQPRRDVSRLSDEEDESVDESEVPPTDGTGDGPGLKPPKAGAEDPEDIVSPDEDFLPGPQNPNPDAEPIDDSSDDQGYGRAMRADPHQRTDDPNLARVGLDSLGGTLDSKQWTPVDWKLGSGLRGGWRGSSPSKDSSPSAETLRKAADGCIVPLGPQERTQPPSPPIAFMPFPTKNFGVLPLQGKHGKQKLKRRPQFAELRDLMGTGPKLEGVNASEIQQRLRKSKSALDSMRESLNGMTTQLRSRESKAAPPARNPSKSFRKPYSVILAEPYIKVNGALGCLARMPMPCEAFALSFLPASASGTSEEKNGKSGTRWSQELWVPYLRDTTLRVFASCGLSAQVGRFKKRFADFTAASLRLDLGLTSADSPPGLAVVQGGKAGDETDVTSHQQIGRHCRHRAFALEGRGIWHAASLSLTQQVWGPIRAQVSTRVALDIPSQEKQERKHKASLGSILGGAPWVQPVLMETVYGLDVVIPGSQGAARACAWFSPVRKEGMLELRLG